MEDLKALFDFANEVKSKYLKETKGILMIDTIRLNFLKNI